VLLLPAAIEPLTIHADSAAGYAVGLEPYGIGQFTGRNIWTWPLRDPTVALPRKIPGRLILQADFRPGTTNVYALMRDNVPPSPAPGPPDECTCLRCAHFTESDGDPTWGTHSGHNDEASQTSSTRGGQRRSGHSRASLFVTSPAGMGRPSYGEVRLRRPPVTWRSS